MKTVRISIINFSFVLLVAILFQCSEEGVLQQNPPLLGNERINAWYDGSSTFWFDTPEEVKYLVLGVFDALPQTDGEKILNPEHLIAGSRTGLNGFGRNSVELDYIYDYDPAEGDFDESSDWSELNSWWAVWGYDEWGNLTHSSSATLEILP